MRESRRTERMQLPRDSTELWLESQKPKPAKAKVVFVKSENVV